MKYFIDTEFLEGKQTKSFMGIKYGKTLPTIDLISIGIISDDGREYYAISNEFNLKEAWNRYDKQINKNYPHGAEYSKVYWIRENVLRPIFDELLSDHKLMIKCLGDKYAEDLPRTFCYEDLKWLIKVFGFTNKEIAENVLKFCSNEIKHYNQFGEFTRPNPEFYGYYCDYDWVVFCWLFGKMADLPNGFPMYCIDLKQMLNDKALPYSMNDRILSIESAANLIGTLPGYPEQKNEHNALSDAKWNFELYKFLQALK